VAQGRAGRVPIRLRIQRNILRQPLIRGDSLGRGVALEELALARGTAEGLTHEASRRPLQVQLARAEGAAHLLAGGSSTCSNTLGEVHFQASLEAYVLLQSGPLLVAQENLSALDNSRQVIEELRLGWLGGGSILASPGYFQIDEVTVRKEGSIEIPGT